MNNIVLITIDCLRPDHLNCYGYRRKTSPYISRLAKGGWLFSKMYANSSYTCASIASMITSTYPFDFKEYFEFSTPAAISKRRTLVSEVLEKKGFTNAFFHDNPYLSPFFGYHRGFKNVVDFGARKVGKTTKRAWKKAFGRYREIRRFFSRINKLRLLYGRWYRKDVSLNTNCEAVLSEAYNWVKDVDSPYFVWCHLMDCHTPYSPKHEALNAMKFRKSMAFFLIYKNWGLNLKLSKNELELFKVLYDIQILRIDEALKEYLPKLAKDGFENTYVIITADHGEEFMEEGFLGHSRPLSNTLLRVPLIIYGGNLMHRSLDAESSLIDLAPTILDLAGCESFDGFKGRSLLRPAKQRLIIAQGIFKGKRIQRTI